MIMAGVREKPTLKNAIEASKILYDLKLAYFKNKQELREADKMYFFSMDYCALCALYFHGGCWKCPLNDGTADGSCCIEYESFIENMTYGRLIKLAERINSL